MRVGANTRQHARIKKMRADGTPPHIIARTMRMTDQSLEKILAHIEGREEKILQIEENPQIQEMRLQNADLLQRLAKYEDVNTGEVADTTNAEKTEDDETE